MANEKMTDIALAKIIADTLEAAKASAEFDISSSLSAKVKAPVKTAAEAEVLLAKHKTKTNGQRMNAIKRVLVLGGTVVLSIQKNADNLYKPDDHGLGGNATSFAAKVADGRIKGLDNDAAVTAAKVEVGVKTPKDTAIAKNRAAFKVLGAGMTPLGLDAKGKKIWSDSLQALMALNN